MTKRPDLEHWYRHPASVSGVDLARAAVVIGLVHRRTAGSHFIFKFPGRGGHVSIPVNVKGDRTKRDIIRRLQEIEEGRRD